MYKTLLALCVCLVLTAGCAEKSTNTTNPVGQGSTSVNAAKATSGEDAIRRELDSTAQKLLKRVSNTITPSKSKKSVSSYGKEYVAKYIEIDPKQYTIDMRPATRPGTYNGFVRYTEQVYQCRGKTQREALSAPCTPASSRRVNEMLHYDGKKWYY